MNAALDPAVSRFTTHRDDSEEEAEDWRGKVLAFLNLYGFLSQVIPYQDSDLERLYVFLRHLAPKLPRRKSGPAYQFDDEVRLEYYRLQKISEGSISLGDGEARRLDGPTEVGSGLVRPQPVPLSQLIHIVNERFGTDFNEADQLFFDQIVEAAMADDGLRQAAAVNPGDKFELVFKSLLENLFVERMDQNEDIFVRFMNDASFQKIVTAWMASETLSAAEEQGHSRRIRTRRIRGTTAPPADRRAPAIGTLLDLCAARPLKAAAAHSATPSRSTTMATRGQRSRPSAASAAACSSPRWSASPWSRPSRRRVLPLRGARRGLAPRQDGARADARRGRSGERRALHRQALREREGGDGDSWRHTNITLQPLNSDFEPIVLTGADEGSLQVVAEVVEVLGGAT